jgi:hypothetical protein
MGKQGRGVGAGNEGKREGGARGERRKGEGRKGRAVSVHTYPAGTTEIDEHPRVDLGLPQAIGGLQVAVRKASGVQLLQPTREVT